MAGLQVLEEMLSLKQAARNSQSEVEVLRKAKFQTPVQMLFPDQYDGGSMIMGIKVGNPHAPRCNSVPRTPVSPVVTPCPWPGKHFADFEASCACAPCAYPFSLQQWVENEIMDVKKKLAATKSVLKLKPDGDDLAKVYIRSQGVRQRISCEFCGCPS